MSRLTSRLVLGAVFLASGASLYAQDYTPKIVTTLKNSNELLDDLEWVLKLTTPEEQKQWPVLKDYLDIFLIGVDPARPLRNDVIMGAKIDRYILSVPVSDFRRFRRDSLFDLGVDLKSVRGDRELYQCEGFFEGFMRYSASSKYAVFAERREEVPKDLAEPTKEIEHLLSKYDGAIWGRNVAEGLKERHDRVQSDRKELVADLKKTKDETDTEFAVRKAVYEAMLDEFERIYAEGKEFTLGAILDQASQKAQLDLQADPLADTPFAASLQQAGTAPGRFAGIQRSENSILSGRINMQLDEMRQNYFLKISAAMRANAKADAEAEQGLNDQQKATRGRIIDMVFDILEAGLKDGTADGFVEAHSNPSGKNTLLFGSWTVDGDKVVDIIKLLPESAPDTTVSIDDSKEGDLAIHKINLSTERHPNLAWFFGGLELYVATKPDQVWVAVGENALEELRAAIQATSAPPPTESQNQILAAFLRMGPWMELRDRDAKDKTPEAPATKKTAKKSKKDKKVEGLGDLFEEGGSPKLRQMAIEASKPGDDTIDLALQRSGDSAVGSLTANTGVLRFIGKVMADFTKENLGDE